MLRMSGHNALTIANALISKKTEWMERRAFLSSIFDSDGSRIDTAMILYMKGPRSFTGEDVVEISCHGNPLIVDAIIERAIQLGARVARNGEFTRRAVENNKLSLLQAEALNELIHSVSIEGNQVAQAGLAGQVDDNEQEIREKLLDICAEIEAKMDYPQEDLSDVHDQEISSELKLIAEQSTKAARAWKGNRIRLQGAKVAILGPVNAGKSSLFNHLVSSRRAIVNARPGTTRDIIERRVVLDGIEVCFFDTAGIRFETDDPIEAEGIQMGLELAQQSDLCLFVVPIDQDLGVMKKVQESVPNIPSIVIASHADKGGIPNFKADNIISNTTKEGLDELQQSIRCHLGLQASKESRWISLSQRQSELFIAIARHLEQAADSLTGILGPAVAAEEITQALERLAVLRGENAREDILDRLFSRFCIGK